MCGGNNSFKGVLTEAFEETLESSSVSGATMFPALLRRTENFTNRELISERIILESGITRSN